MSRIGKLPVIIPEKVNVTAEDTLVKVEGPKGRLEREFHAPVIIEVNEGKVHVNPALESRFSRAMHGTVRSHIANMVKGVTEGFSKDLEIQGVGFRAALTGDILDINLGYSHPIKFQIPEGIQITLQENTKIKVEGMDKHLVGEVAARIKRLYPVEPYKGKGVRILGEFVRRKEGKKAG
jgi:large subunit ribosomal protein L6